MREHTREAIGISSSILSFCPAARVSSFLFPQQLYIGFFPSQPAKHAEENRREHAQRESDGMAHSVQNDRLSFCLGGLTPGHGQPRQTDKSIHIMHWVYGHHQHSRKAAQQHARIPPGH